MPLREGRDLCVEQKESRAREQEVDTFMRTLSSDTITMKASNLQAITCTRMFKRQMHE
jgi:hypothetical protein